MQNKVLIESNTTDYCLTVHFLDKNGGTVKKFQFYNFIDNGIWIVSMIGHWVNDGILPVQTKGLLEIQ